MKRLRKSPAKKDLAFFEKKVLKFGDGTNSCWVWRGPCNPAGYGLYWDGYEARTKYVHRGVWELTHGIIPEGMEVCHTCDAPACCNPTHLFLGTHQDNMRDAISKKRLGRKKGTPNKKDVLELAPLAGAEPVLSIDDVLCIKQYLAVGGYPHQQIADTFKVSLEVVQKIESREIWDWVKLPQEIEAEKRAEERAGWNALKK